MKLPRVDNTLGDGLQRWECLELPYDDVGEGQVEMGGGSAEMLLLGVARQQPPFVFPSLVSPVVTFGGHGIALAYQVASEDTGRGEGRRPWILGTGMRRREVRSSCRRCGCNLGRNGKLNTVRRVHLGLDRQT